jgi:hypothetical protein
MSDILDRAGDAALKLAGDRPWPEISLRDIALEAGASFAELYVAADSKAGVLDALGRRFDRAALDAADAQSRTRTSTTACSRWSWPASRRWSPTASP